MNRIAKKLCAALFVLLRLQRKQTKQLHMGQASIRIVTAERKVIYIDP